MFIAFTLFLGVVLWNVYLTNKIVTFGESEQQLQLKLDMCEGDRVVLNDELITVRDSVRILNNELKAMLEKQKD